MGHMNDMNDMNSNTTTHRQNIGRRIAAAIGLLCAAAYLPSAMGQAYPSRPLTFVYPYPAGSSSDTAWRTISQDLSKKLGQPVIHENKVGAGGRVGLDFVIKSAPDGYTLGMINNVLSVWQPLMDPRFNIEPGKDYTPIVHAIETPLMLAAKINAPFRDLKSLIAYAKANPGKLNAGSSGPGSGAHLGLALLNYQAGIDVTHVPYKGAAPALTSLLAGETDLFFADAGAKPHIDAGKLMAIAVGSGQRWSLVPGVPTLDEAGLPGFRNTSWTSVGGPAGIPADVVSRLNRAFNDVLTTPEVRAKLEAAGWAIKGGTQQEFIAVIRGDTELYRPVIRAANIKLDQ